MLGISMYAHYITSLVQFYETNDFSSCRSLFEDGGNGGRKGESYSHKLGDFMSGEKVRKGNLKAT
jgi:hypothetical protein